MRSERHETKKGKNKGKKWKTFLLLLLLIFGTTLAYSYYQYKQGVSQSMKKIEKKDTQEYKFEGQKDQYGDTNILLLGSDTKGKGNSRADTIMIAHYNEGKGTFKLTSIMRDSYVDIPGHGKHKINSAFARGTPRTDETDDQRKL
ncbi:LCP family protein [Neobacillus sp. PS3-34]|uniref:LCP family protein n=1 Tax=Neobacillus sp. PS3-34 TaxID=3070678 RepID=UPI0027E084E4|nr:LCP family protein [Neobacillus sp. PS3-34]WML49630.1 LCP family protein [Neobacillus sp. PS3-34]